MESYTALALKLPLQF